MKKIAVFGSGMAGFGAVHRLHTEREKSVLFEKMPYHGGHTASHTFGEGFTLDQGPHVSFTKDERMKNLLAESVDQKYEKFDRAIVNNYWKGHWIKHPAQCNLYGLPEALVVNIIRDFVEEKYSQRGPINNYADWLLASFGKTFAETFPMEYGLKYHTTSAQNMSIDWIGPRLYQANLEEVLLGAISPSSPNIHYVDDFRYPTFGGFVSYLKMFTQETEMRLNHQLVRVNPKSKEISFANGVIESYDHMISSIPLPELIPMIEGVPRDVLEASQKLACTEVVLVTIGVARPDLLDAHWTYIYDRDIFFTRLSTPHLQSRNNAPPGCGCIMAECYYSKKYRPLDRKPDECIDSVIQDLKRIGPLREDDKVIFRNAQHVKYANIIFDLDCADASERSTTGWPPSSWIPTSKDSLVRVEGFSKISATLRPASACEERGARLSSMARSRRDFSSPALSSAPVRKWRGFMRRASVGLLAGSLLTLGAGCGSSGSPAGTTTTAATGPKATTGLKVNTTPRFVAPSASSPVRSGVVQVAYRNIAIAPDVLRVKVGSTLRWTSYDSVEHNVTSRDGPTHFASGNFGEGKAFQVTLTRPGVIHYLCTLHPTSMNGTIEVVR